MKDILKMEMSPQRTATQQNDGKLTKVSDCVVHIPVEIIDQQTKYTFSVQRFLGQVIIFDLFSHIQNCDFCAVAIDAGIVCEMF